MNKNKIEQLKDMMKAKKEIEEKKTEQESTETAKENVAVDEMEAQIKAAEDEAKAHYDKLLRVMAEFENFKKRMEKERTEQAKFANQSIISEILPVLDDLDRVLEHIPENASPESLAIADGVKLIKNHLTATLSKFGLEQTESALGKPFDPAVHEAVAHIESSEFKTGMVAAEYRRGWKLYDRIIRAATVAVAK